MYSEILFDKHAPKLSFTIFFFFHETSAKGRARNLMLDFSKKQFFKQEVLRTVEHIFAIQWRACTRSSLGLMTVMNNI